MEPITASTLLPVTEARAADFEAHYRAHRDRVYVWALRYGAGRTAWAEDVTHDVFLQLHRHLRRLDGQDLGAWLYRVTANCALARLRSERSWLRRLTHLFDPPPPVELPDDAHARKQDAAAALALLATLPPKERLIISMHLLDGHSQRDIAATLGFSEGYVSKLMARAWARIRAAGWEVSDAP